MNQYRFFLIATLALLSILFFFGGPDHHSPRSYKATWNLGHILYFALLVFLHPRLKAAPHRTQIILTIALSEVQKSPQNRSMDLTQIRGIDIFATRLAQPRTIYIDDLILF